MAFFKFRKDGDEQSATSVKPESIEGMRRRAKYRLIGAAVLVLVGVIGFPMLFDRQQRPIAVDTPIEIPDRNKVKPPGSASMAAKDAGKPVSAAPVLPVAPVAETAAAPVIEEKAVTTPVAAVVDASRNVAKAEAKPVSKPLDKPVEKSQPALKTQIKADDGAKIQALLEAKAPDKKADASEGRYVVQIGAFADAVRAREVRQKVEHAGLKTYTHVAQTKDGARIRVRVGPFGTKSEADKAAEKVKKIGLPAGILIL